MSSHRRVSFPTLAMPVSQNGIIIWETQGKFNQSDELLDLPTSIVSFALMMPPPVPSSARTIQKSDHIECDHVSFKRSEKPA